ncbi:MAG: hypothetical protein OXG37_05015 [Actinomycetia bacterium]|nr:hypothetical protein [Actinomycetes bacterium]
MTEPIKAEPWLGHYGSPIIAAIAVVAAAAVWAYLKARSALKAVRKIPKITVADRPPDPGENPEGALWLSTREQDVAEAAPTGSVKPSRFSFALRRSTPGS